MEVVRTQDFHGGALDEHKFKATVQACRAPRTSQSDVFNTLRRHRSTTKRFLICFVIGLALIAGKR